MRPNIHNAAPSVRPVHSTAPNMRPNIHSAASGGLRPNISSSSGSQYPANIPFPSLSGVTTVTKKEFNNASDSIQVDGACDVMPSTDDVIPSTNDVAPSSEDGIAVSPTQSKKQEQKSETSTRVQKDHKDLPKRKHVSDF